MLYQGVAAREGTGSPSLPAAQAQFRPRRGVTAKLVLLVAGLTLYALVGASLHLRQTRMMYAWRGLHSSCRSVVVTGWVMVGTGTALGSWFCAALLHHFSYCYTVSVLLFACGAERCNCLVRELGSQATPLRGWPLFRVVVATATFPLVSALFVAVAFPCVYFLCACVGFVAFGGSSFIWVFWFGCGRSAAGVWADVWRLGWGMVEASFFLRWGDPLFVGRELDLGADGPDEWADQAVLLTRIHLLTTAVLSGWCWATVVPRLPNDLVRRARLSLRERFDTVRSLPAGDQLAITLCSAFGPAGGVGADVVPIVLQFLSSSDDVPPFKGSVTSTYVRRLASSVCLLCGALQGRRVADGQRCTSICTHPEAFV